ncbi:3619_t:CDS:2, partial [Racocetra persica]
INPTSNVLLVGTKNKPNVQCITPRTNPTSNILVGTKNESNVQCIIIPRTNPTSNILVGTKNEFNVQYISRQQESNVQCI